MIIIKESTYDDIRRNLECSLNTVLNVAIK